jgi:hypothetical protein
MHSRSVERLQSGIVLPTARTLYLLGAVLSALAIVAAVLVAFYFQLSSWQRADQSEVPSGIPVTSIAPALDPVEQRLTGPTAVRFVGLERQSGGPAEGEVVGRFEMEAGNGPAAYPGDIQIVGGTDANLFEAAYEPSSGLTGLAATSALVKRLADPAAANKANFQVRVLAFDSAGNRSAPLDVSVALAPASKSSAPSPAAETDLTDLGGTGALPGIARELAGRVAGRGTPEYFDAYKAALEQPERCDAAGNAVFLDHYRRAASHFAKRLNGGNIGSFYGGVCEGWRTALDQSRQANASAQAERERVIAQNASARLTAEFKSAQAKFARNAALAFAFSAVVCFMMIALFLAFLAIEGHSAAVRHAIELLAQQKETGR